jgi:uncharacterized integral membrane protein
MRILSIIFVTILAVLATIFAIQNGQMTEIRLFTNNIRFESPLSIWLLGCLAVGFIVGWFSTIPGRWRRSREIKGYKDQVARLEKELHDERLQTASEQAALLTPPPSAGETAILK